MACYLGLDVSDKTTHLCAVDGAGGAARRVRDPRSAIAATIAKRCSGAARVVLETGALSVFLYHG